MANVAAWLAISRVGYRTCPLCEATCGLEITIEAGSVKRIRGDRANPFSAGFVCPKGTVLGRLHEDPDRLRAPLVKRGSRHVEVSWSEAFAEVSDRVGAVRSAHGNDAIAMYFGNPNAHSFQNSLAIRPLARALGSRNVYSASTLDQMPKHISSAYMFGAASAIPVPDIDRTDFLVLLGANPYESNGSLATAPDWPGRLDRIRDRGGTVVVVDPRRTKTAANADRHIAIIPGTDAALLMAVIAVLFEEDLVNLGSVGDYVTGLETVRSTALPYTPDRVQAATGVPAGVIRELARDLAAADRAAVYGRMGTHTSRFGTIASWAVDVINVITGNLDREGGAMFPMGLHTKASRPARRFRTGRWTSRVRELDEVLGELPTSTLIDEITTPGEGQVRAFITIGGNPALTSPDAAALDDALGALEFMVSVDPYVNETTRHADVILPPPSALEKSHYDLAFTTLSVRNYAMWSEPVFEKDPTQPSEFEILVTLTGILSGLAPDTSAAGLAEASLVARVGSEVSNPSSPIAGRDASDIMKALAMHDELPDRFLDLMIRTGARGDGFGSDPGGWTLQRLKDQPHGVDLGPLQPRVPDVISTESGLIELAPESIVEDVARLTASIESTEQPDLMLVSRRELRSNNSWLHNIDVLVRGQNRCTLRVHPADADRLALVEGEMASVTSSAGSVAVVVEVNDEMRPGVVSLPYGWGHDASGTRLGVASKRPGVNTNILTDRSVVDAVSGNAVFNGIPVVVQRTSASTTPVGQGTAERPA